MSTAPSQNHALLRTLSRGFEVMRVLSETSPSTLRVISERTGISRGAVHRILSTLVLDGFVRYDNGSYVLGTKTLSLSAASDEAKWLETAQQSLQELCIQTKWPILITKQNGLAMQVCAEAEEMSPLRHRRVRIGLKIPLLASAAGRAVVAQYDAPMRELLIRAMAVSAEFPQDEELCRVPDVLIERLKRVRDRGYAVGVASRTTIISVPIIPGAGGILGALSLRYFTSSASPQEIVERHFEAMQQAAATIAQSC